MPFNKVILMGGITNDPETRTTPNGQSVTNFSIGVTRTYKGADGTRKEEQNYFNCTAWGATGETIAKYLGKGRQILVSGRLQYRSWEDKETGKKRSTVDVVVEDFSFINDGKGGGNSSQNNSNTNDSTNNSANNSSAAATNIDEPIDLSDIPF